MSAAEQKIWLILTERTAERDRARDVAVALEQEVADLRERLEFATWRIA